MGLGDRIRRFLTRGRRTGNGWRDLDSEQLRDLVSESLDETEATAEMVELARDAHERARDLMRQGLYNEALDRFTEAVGHWEEQERICRERGFKNLWPGRVERVGREMEELRILHLDILDPEDFQWLRRRAELRGAARSRVLEMGRVPDGVGEQEVFTDFPAHQHDEVRSLLFHAQQRGWLSRTTRNGRYRLVTTGESPRL